MQHRQNEESWYPAPGCGGSSSARLPRRRSMRSSSVELPRRRIMRISASGATDAILAMDLTGTFHRPAGIDPLLVVSNNLGWSFLAVPLFAGALLLTLFACVWRRWLR